MNLSINNIRIFDGYSEIANTNIHVKDGTLTFAAVEGGEAFDFQQFPNATALPGLIDSHLHLAISGADQAEKGDPAGLVSLRMNHHGLVNLRAGVTTVRDMGAKDHIDLQYRTALEQGLTTGPRYVCAGRPIIATGGHTPYMGRQVDGPIEARKAAREQITAGVDWLKMMATGGVMTLGTDPRTQQLAFDEIEAVVKTAHMAGKKVAVHAQGGNGVIDALTAGVDSLEHGLWLTDEAIDLLLEKNIAFVPTLSAFYLIAEGIAVAGVKPPQWAIDKTLEAVDAHQQSFAKAVNAGVRIVAGTDYVHGSLPFEMQLMSQYGMEAEAVLRSATSSAAEMLEMDRLGALREGYLADLVVVDGNPLADIAALENTLLVVSKGEIVHIAESLKGERI